MLIYPFGRQRTMVQLRVAETRNCFVRIRLAMERNDSCILWQLGVCD
jgi:hypothetical protein